VTWQWLSPGRSRRAGSGPAPAGGPRSDRGPYPAARAGVVEHEHRPRFVTSELQSRGCPRGSRSAASEYSCSSRREALRRRLFRGERHRQDRERLPCCRPRVECELPAFAQVSRVYRTLRQGRILRTHTSPGRCSGASYGPPRGAASILAGDRRDRGIADYREKDPRRSAYCLEQLAALERLGQRSRRPSAIAVSASHRCPDLKRPDIAMTGISGWRASTRR